MMDSSESSGADGGAGDLGAAWRVRGRSVGAGHRGHGDATEDKEPRASSGCGGVLRALRFASVISVTRLESANEVRCERGAANLPVKSQAMIPSVRPSREFFRQRSVEYLS